MARLHTAKAKMDNGQTIQTIISQVGIPFHAKVDHMRNLADEIEACRKKIWQCVGQDESQRLVVKTKAVFTESNEMKETSAVNWGAAGKTYQSPRKGNANRSNIEFQVNAMKVAQLKKELKTRGLDTNGLKKDLRARLLNAIFQETEMQQNEMTATAINPVKLDSPKRKAEDVEASKSHMVESTDVKENTDVKIDDVTGNVSSSHSGKGDFTCENDQADIESRDETESRPAKVSCSSTHATTHSVIVPEAGPAEQESTDPKGYWENLSKPSPAPNSQSEAPAVPSSSNKRARSPLRGMVKNAFKALGNSASAGSSQAVPMDVDAPSDTSPEEDISPPNSEVSACSKISGKKVRELVSKISSNTNYSSSSSTHVGGSTSALSKSVQKKKEARLAKMAEMRNKSKPLATSKVALTPKEYSSTLSLLNATGGSTNGKKKNLAAQMREKAAVAAAYRKENIPANHPSLTSTGKRNLHSSQSDVIPDPLGGTLKQGFLKKAKISSPLDTYEISDRDDSDTDDSGESDAENEKQKKKIPTWALKANLLPALEQQYNGCVNGRRVDPDDLFPEVQTCDLEAIFESKKSKYTRRTSSGNWTNDKVTVAEKLVYKRTMGFSTKA